MEKFSAEKIVKGIFNAKEELIESFKERISKVERDMEELKRELEDYKKSLRFLESEIEPKINGFNAVMTARETGDPTHDASSKLIGELEKYSDFLTFLLNDSNEDGMKEFLNEWIKEEKSFLNRYLEKIRMD